MGLVPVALTIWFGLRTVLRIMYIMLNWIHVRYTCTTPTCVGSNQGWDSISCKSESLKPLFHLACSLIIAHSVIC